MLVYARQYLDEGKLDALLKDPDADLHALAMRLQTHLERMGHTVNDGIVAALQYRKEKIERDARRGRCK